MLIYWLRLKGLKGVISVEANLILVTNIFLTIKKKHLSHMYAYIFRGASLW